MKLRLRTKGTGVPTHWQPHATSLTLSACNIKTQTKYWFLYFYSEVLDKTVEFNLKLEHSCIKNLS